MCVCVCALRPTPKHAPLNTYNVAKLERPAKALLVTFWSGFPRKFSVKRFRPKGESKASKVSLLSVEMRLFAKFLSIGKGLVRGERFG